MLRKEFDKLLEWLADEPVPDVINLPNSLLIGLAGPLRDALKRPVCCTLQGEDLFLDGLVEPYRTQAIDLIRAAGAGRRSLHRRQRLLRARRCRGCCGIPADRDRASCRSAST